MLTIYHNPRCSKSRQALALLQERDVALQIVRYLETPPSAKTIKALLKQLDMSAKELLRRGEAVYKELNLGRKDIAESELIAAMVQHPILIERPIITDGKRAVIGRPPDNVEKLL